MFDLPNAKRVRRSELHSPSSSRASTPESDNELLSKLRTHTQFDVIDQPSSQPLNASHVAAEAAATASDDELEFRLFAPTTKATSDAVSAPAPTVRLRSPSVEVRDPSLVVAARDLSYYFAAPPSAVKQAEYASAAITGHIVRAWSKTPCPGCAYSWKVISIPSANAKAVLATTPAEQDFLPEADEKKRRRAGKKDRIKKRIKAEKTRAKKIAEGKLKEEKEKAEREKRARRNREKKFKKRARDKAKKAKGGDDEDNAGDADSGSDGKGSGDDE